jgi:predicted permease
MGKRDDALDKELRFHLAQQVDDYVAAGMSREEAERRARIELGGVEQVKEECRESRSGYVAAGVLRDVGYALRLLGRSPAFTAAAVLSVALGIGANTAIFSIVEALLLRTMPVPHPERLVQLQVVVGGRAGDSFSYPMIRALGERKDVFASLGGFTGNGFSVGPADVAVRVPGSLVSGGFFVALELQPAAGRLLVPEDDEPGAALVAVISESYWRRQFQHEVRAVGSTLVVEGRPVTIVGVMPAGFNGATPGEPVDLVMSYQALPQLQPERGGLLRAGNHFSRILARPATGLTPRQVTERLAVVWPSLVEVGIPAQAPPERRQAMLQSALRVVPGGTGWTPLRGQYQKPLGVLMGLTSLVLVVACANVANLLLARSAARRREIAVRLAIGASRARVVRQLLIESLLLAGIGAVLGVALARGGSSLLLRLVADPQLLRLGVGLNLSVLGFTLATTLLTGVLFGLAPAFRATSEGPGAALAGARRGVTGVRDRLASGLVAAQTALAVVLLVGAGLLVRTLLNLRAVDPGFRHAGVLMLDVNPRQAWRAAGNAGDARVAAFFREGLEELARIPGVTAAGLSNFTPVSGGFWSQQVLVNGQRVAEGEPPFFAVAPGFFAALQLRLHAGRDFTLSDDGKAPAVAIVNESFARRYLRAGEALGQRVTAADSRFWQDMEVIGVVSDAAHYSLREPARPCVFVPFFQQAPDRIGFGTFEIRGEGSLAAIASAVEAVIGPKLPGATVKTRSFTAQVESSIRSERLTAQLAGFFGLLALALGAIGLYGLLAYQVAQRTGEIGVRIALGARRSQVIWMVLRGGLRLVGIGLAVGVPAALLASRLLTGMLFGLTPTDAPTVAIATAVLGLAGIAAGVLPARRAARVEPMAALRCE